MFFSEAVDQGGAAGGGGADEGKEAGPGRQGNASGAPIDPETARRIRGGTPFRAPADPGTSLRLRLISLQRRADQRPLERRVSDCLTSLPVCPSDTVKPFPQKKVTDFPEKTEKIPPENPAA